MLAHFSPSSDIVIAMLVCCFLLVLAFEATNGFHDTSNAVATVIYTNALKPIPAVVWSGLLNFIGVLVGGIAVAYALVEILPPDHTDPESTAGQSRVWLSVDSHGGTRRVYVAKPGPIATLLLVLAFSVLLTVSFVVALGLFAIFVGISAVVVSGLLIYGLIRAALSRFR